MATYVTSDLHGYTFENFMGLLNSAGFGKDDFLYILGDVIDRGEDGAKYLEWLLTVDNVQLILGNHEAMLLACDFVFEVIAEGTILEQSPERLDLLTHWMQNGAAVTLLGMKEIIDQRPEKIDDIIDYLRDAPLYEAVTVGERDFLLVHGGLGNFSKDKKFSEYTMNELVWHRPTPGERYFDDITTIFGHTPVDYLGASDPTRMLVTDTWIDIDTGAADLIRSPMLLRLDDMKEFYIGRN